MLFRLSKDNAEKIKNEIRFEIEMLTPDTTRLVNDLNSFTSSVTSPENLTLRHKLNLQCLRAWAESAANEISSLNEKLSRVEQFLSPAEQTMFSNSVEDISRHVEQVHHVLKNFNLLKTFTKRTATTSVGIVTEDANETQAYLRTIKVRWLHLVPPVIRMHVVFSLKKK